MISLTLEKKHVEVVLDALEIAGAWHKQERKFPQVSKLIRYQMEKVTPVT